MMLNMTGSSRTTNQVTKTNTRTWLEAEVDWIKALNGLQDTENADEGDGGRGAVRDDINMVNTTIHTGVGR